MDLLNKRMDLAIGGTGATAPRCLPGWLLSALLSACRRTSQVGNLQLKTGSLKRDFIFLE